MDFSKALVEFSKILGTKNVIFKGEKIAEFERATFKTEQKVSAILYPSNKKQIQKCLDIANKYKVPLYPISKGKNWGYGSKVPVTSKSVIMSLEKMNKIIEVNDEIGYVTVEPGVTFGQLYKYLSDTKSNLIAPSIGSSPEASLIGNALERGIGKGPYGERAMHSCNLEVILANGREIQTGYGSYKNAFSSNSYKWGVGPSIDGLFFQSNFGIVTKMTFWLSIKPQHFQLFFYSIKDPKKLPALVDALHLLRQEGTLNTTFTVFNNHRVVSMKEQYPWELMKGKTPLSDRILKDKSISLGGASWIGDGAILAASKLQGTAAKKRIKKVLKKKVDKLIFIDNQMYKILKLLQKPIKILTKVSVVEILYFFKNSLYLGIPVLKPLNMCYWRKKTPLPSNMNPDHDGCGIIWCAPSLPLTAKHVSHVLELLTQIYKKYNFEPNLGINFMTERNVVIIAAILFDRNDLEQDNLALKCYHEMSKKLLKEGYPPYRLGIQSMDKENAQTSEYNQLLQGLKSHFGPNNIIAPGRYNL